MFAENLAGSLFLSGLIFVSCTQINQSFLYLPSFFVTICRSRTEFRVELFVSAGMGTVVPMNRKSSLEFVTARRFSCIS